VTDLTIPERAEAAARNATKDAHTWPTRAIGDAVLAAAASFVVAAELRRTAHALAEQRQAWQNCGPGECYVARAAGLSDAIAELTRRADSLDPEGATS
jgi:hypothetical protein